MVSPLLILAAEAATEAVQTEGLPSWTPYAVVAAVLAALVLFVLLLMLRRRKKRFVYRGGIPPAMPRRDLLYEEDVPPEQKIRIAEQYLKQGLVEEALEFYGYAGCREGLERMKAEAMKTGSAYMLGRTADFVPELVAPEDWEKLAENAERAGRAADAERARRILRGEEEEEPGEDDEESEDQTTPQE